MKKFGFFYYSPKMRAVRDELNKPRNFARQILTGKIVEYTDWFSRFPFRQISKWDDMKLVAIGWYDHTDYRPPLP